MGSTPLISTTDASSSVASFRFKLLENCDELRLQNRLYRAQTAVRGLRLYADEFVSCCLDKGGQLRDSVSPELLLHQFELGLKFRFESC